MLCVLLFSFFLHIFLFSNFYSSHEQIYPTVITEWPNVFPLLWKDAFVQLNISLGFPGGSEVKASARNAGDLGLIPGSGRFPWRRKWQPTPVFLPGESHGRRSLVGCSPRGSKESDTTERLHSLTHSLKYLMACSFCFIKLLCCHFGAD